MPINTEIARQTRDQILFHPETYDQGDWFTFKNAYAKTLEECGTTACVAGNATILAGLVTYSQRKEWSLDGERLITRWDAVPSVGSGSWSTAGVVALGLQDYFVGHHGEIIIPVPDVYLSPEQADDLYCGDSDCPECFHGIEGVALFHGSTSQEDVLAALDWLVKEGEKQDASLDQVIEDMAKEASE